MDKEKKLYIYILYILYTIYIIYIIYNIYIIYLIYNIYYIYIIYIFNIYICQAPVAHACNPSHSGGRDQEEHGSKPAQPNSSRDPISKISIVKKGWRNGSRHRPWVQAPVPKERKYPTQNMAGWVAQVVESLSRKCGAISPKKREKYMYIFIYIHVHVYAYIFMYICTYIYVCIHT
jgi:hypothetical protein